MPPRTTKRKTTANLKTKNNQNLQKIKLHENLTAKEFKKKHSSRPVGGAEMGSWAERTHGKAAAGRLGSPTSVCRKTRKNNWGVRQTPQPRAPAWGNKALNL